MSKGRSKPKPKKLEVFLCPTCYYLLSRTTNDKEVQYGYLKPNTVVWALLSSGEKVNKDDYLTVGEKGEMIFTESMTDIQAFEFADNSRGKEPMRIKVIFQ